MFGEILHLVHLVFGQKFWSGLEVDLTHVCRGMAEAGEWISIVVALSL